MKVEFEDELRDRKDTIKLKKVYFNNSKEFSVFVAHFQSPDLEFFNDLVHFLVGLGFGV